MEQPMLAKRILVVEDEMAVGLDLQSTLTEAGFEVIGPVATFDEAMRTAAREAFDTAVLDANLNGQNVGGLAESLILRRIPFVVVSGYAREHLPLALAHAPLIPKPFDAVKLIAVIRRLCGEPASAGTSHA
jgi:DNA-binding response OmpR family regulator